MVTYGTYLRISAGKKKKNCYNKDLLIMCVFKTYPFRVGMSGIAHYLEKILIPSDIYSKQNYALLAISFISTKGRSLLAHDRHACNLPPKNNFRIFIPSHVSIKWWKKPTWILRKLWSLRSPFETFLIVTFKTDWSNPYVFSPTLTYIKRQKTKASEKRLTCLRI